MYKRQLLGQPTARLVVHGYLCPQDTLLSIHLGLTTPPALFSNRLPGSLDSGSYSFLRKHRVLLRQENRELELPFVARYGCFAAPAAGLPIVAGQQYRLSVQYGGQEVASAVCSIPPLPPDFTVLRDSVLEQGNRWVGNRLAYGDYYFSRIRLRWTDTPGQANYYAYGARYFYTGMAYFQNNTTSPPRADSARVSSFGLITFDGENQQQPMGLRSDAGADGQPLTSRRATVRALPAGSFSAVQVQARGEVSLAAVEKSLYDFNLRLQQSGGEFENPFACLLYTSPSPRD